MAGRSLSAQFRLVGEIARADRVRRGARVQDNVAQEQSADGDADQVCEKLRNVSLLTRFRHAHSR